MGDFHPEPRRPLRISGETPEYHAARIELRLMRIVKWSLYSAMYIIYLFLIGLVFVQSGWQWGLLALFFILCVHPLRHFWDDADKALYDLKNHDQYDEAVSAPVEKYQKKVALVLRGGLYAFDTAFVVMVGFVLSPIWWSVGALLGLVSVELLHHLVRRQNLRMREAERKTWDKLEEPEPEPAPETDECDESEKGFIEGQ